MARIVTGGLSTFRLDLHLDPQTLDLYGLRELFSTPARTSAGTPFSAYTGGDAKFAFDTSYNLTWSGATYTFNGSGNVNFSGTVSALVTGSGGIGYGTGSGGTVTQATSKSTAVTLNKSVGQITMNSASLAGGATVAFTVLNSTVATADLILAHRATGGTNGSYQVWVDRVAAGGFDLYVKNLTGGSLAEALQINFAVFKGATS